MSLRTRLIIAFLLLSVVPLTAVTLFSYVSSVNAVENAARRAASDDAADISRRMDVITADVGRRMDSIFDAGAKTAHGVPDRRRHARSRRVRRSAMRRRSSNDSSFSRWRIPIRTSMPDVPGPEARGATSRRRSPNRRRHPSHRRPRRSSWTCRASWNKRSGRPGRSPPPRPRLHRSSTTDSRWPPAAEAGMKAAAEALAASSNRRRRRARNADAGGRTSRRNRREEGWQTARQGERHAEPRPNARHGLAVRPPRPGRDPFRHRSPRRALHARGVAEAAAPVDCRSIVRRSSPRAAVRGASGNGSSWRAKRAAD